MSGAEAGGDFGVEGDERDATVASMEASSLSNTGDGTAPVEQTGPKSSSDPESRKTVSTGGSGRGVDVTAGVLEAFFAFEAEGSFFFFFEAPEMAGTEEVSVNTEVDDEAFRVAFGTDLDLEGLDLDLVTMASVEREAEGRS